MNIVVYIAVSKDGFIADAHGGIDWLSKYENSGEDCGYPTFYKSIDALIFGKNTYEQVLTFDDWPYPDKMSYIFADKNTQPANKDITIVTTDIPAFLQSIKAKKYKNLWLMGGAQLINSFNQLDLINECILTILPDELGSGIALPPAIFNGDGFERISSTDYPSINAVQVHYRKSKR